MSYPFGSERRSATSRIPVRDERKHYLNPRFSHERRIHFGRDDRLRLHYDMLQSSGSSIDEMVVKGPVPSFTRASQGMSFDSVGNLVFAPHQVLFNSNLGTRTGDLPNGYAWAQQSGTISWTNIGSYSEGLFSGTSQMQYMDENTTVVAATTYTLFAYIPDSSITSGNGKFLQASQTSGTDADITDADWDALGGVAGWYGVAFVMGASDTVVILSIGLGAGFGNATGSVTINRLGVVRGNITGNAANVPAKLSGEPLGRWIGTDSSPLLDQPRFAHDPANSNAELGLFMEEARTNIAFATEDFSDAVWTTSNVTVTANDTTAPDGTMTADKVENDITNIYSSLFDTYTVTSGVDYTVSVFAKAGTTTKISLEFRGSGAPPDAFFALSGSGSVTEGTGKIKLYGNGWYRIEITKETLDTSELLIIGFDDFDNAQFDTFFIWGAQVEQGSFATSYIPNFATSGTVTRAKDICSTTDMGWLNAAGGMMFAQGIIPAVSAQERSLMTIDDGGTTDQMRLYMDAAENVNFQTVNSADTEGDSDGAATIVIDTVFKCAGIYADDSVTGFVDGTASTEDTAAAIPVADPATTLRIGDDSGTTEFNGYLQKMKFWNVTKSSVFGLSETS